MQLQMIAPLDIGMEQQDAALGLGQEDFFDLGRTENGLRKRSSARFLTDDNGDLIVESDDEGGVEQDRDADVMEEEGEEKLRDLEVELDGLYDAYQGRLRERDAKFKVNESRRKNAEREEWNGIHEQASNGSESEEGEWDGMQDAKFNDGGSSSGDSVSGDESLTTGRKRKRSENVVANSKRPRLITDLKQPTSVKTSNTTAQIWFSQDVFTGLEDLNGLSDSDGTDNTENDDDISNDNDDEDGVSTHDVVAAEDEDESDVWNIENEVQNNELQAKNKSNFFMLHNYYSSTNFL
jgi:AdoMet-dependent rRNA methyltransferase SPB1